MTSSQHRLAYIDWMRGLACVLMFQTHCYDSWLSAEAKHSEFFRYSQMGGTLPAPLFIFLGGSFCGAGDGKAARERCGARSDCQAGDAARTRKCLGWEFLFRVQEFMLGIPISPWTDLLRVDVLNILGLSMILMGVVCWVAGGGECDSALRTRSFAGALAAATMVAMATPAVWTTWRPRFLPWPLESYLNGVHIFDKPQVWLFPLFPWMAFAFAGLAVGFWLFTRLCEKMEGWSFAFCWALREQRRFAVSMILDGSRRAVCTRVYDYWHTSPNFFLARCGVLLMILSLRVRVVPMGIGASGIQSADLSWERLRCWCIGCTSNLCMGDCRFCRKGSAGSLGRRVGLAAIFWPMLGTVGSENALEGKQRVDQAKEYKREARSASLDLLSSCCDCGILMITSPGLARPSSSRAMDSILCGSVFSVFHFVGKLGIFLFSRAISPCTRCDFAVWCGASPGSRARRKYRARNSREHAESRERRVRIAPKAMRILFVWHCAYLSSPHKPVANCNRL